MRTRLMAAFAAMLAMVLTVAPARADSIFVSLISATDTGFGTWDYLYEVEISSAPPAAASQALMDDYWSLIDFVGLTAFAPVTLLPGWVLTDPFTTTPPPNQAFTDSGAIKNILGTWSLATPTTGVQGTFIATSIYGPGGPTQILYTAQDHSLSPPVTIQGNSGRTGGPVVPLPLAAWGGMALIGAIAGRRAMKICLS